MSNRAERKIIEAMIISAYKELLACLACNGLTTNDTWIVWGEGAKLVFARYTGLSEIAKALGMGDYGYDRIKRVINGEQYPSERL